MKLKCDLDLLKSYLGDDLYRITSYNAAKYYGKNTRWCISGDYHGHEELGENISTTILKIIILMVVIISI